MNATAIIKAIEDAAINGKCELGIRAMTANPVTGEAVTVEAGDELVNSYDWVDGNATDDQIDGVCTVAINWDSFWNEEDAEEIKAELDRVMDIISDYGDDCQIVLVAGDSSYEGTDFGERVIESATAIYIF